MGFDPNGGQGGGGWPPGGGGGGGQGGWPPAGGQPPAQGGFGQPPQQGGFAPQQPAQGGFAPQQPQQGGFGAPPQQGGFGAPPQQGGFGAPPAQPGFGAPQGGFGAPAPGAFGAPAQGGFGAPQGSMGMVPAGGGFGAPGMMSPGGVSDKDQGTAFLLAAFLGTFGADRFYLGQTTLGIVKLLTGGGCLVWALYDLAMIGMGKMKDAQGRTLRGEPIVGTPTRSQSTTFLLSWLGGGLGLDRFYLGQNGLGIAKLLTGGGCGIWALYDMVMVGMGKMKDAQGNSLLPE